MIELYSLCLHGLRTGTKIEWKKKVESLFLKTSIINKVLCNLSASGIKQSMVVYLKVGHILGQYAGSTSFCLSCLDTEGVKERKMCAVMGVPSPELLNQMGFPFDTNIDKVYP